MEEGKEIVKEEGKSLRRGGGAGDQRLGFDDVDVKQDIRMPRLTILQALSKTVVSGKGKSGEIGNSVSKESYGESVDIVPLFLFKTRCQFAPGRGLVMLSRDNEFVTFAKDEFEQYQGRPVEEVPGYAWEGKNPPTFCQVFNFVSLLVRPEVPFPVCFSLMKTGEKVAKDFISVAYMKGGNIFDNVYTVKTQLTSKPKGDFYLPIIDFVRRSSDDEYNVAMTLFDEWHRKKDVIDVEIEDEDADEAQPSTNNDQKVHDDLVQ